MALSEDDMIPYVGKASTLGRLLSSLGVVSEVAPSEQKSGPCLKDTRAYFHLLLREICHLDLYEKLAAL